MSPTAGPDLIGLTVPSTLPYAVFYHTFYESLLLSFVQFDILFLYTSIIPSRFFTSSLMDATTFICSSGNDAPCVIRGVYRVDF